MNRKPQTPAPRQSAPQSADAGEAVGAEAVEVETEAADGDPAADGAGAGAGSASLVFGVGH
jgi:hypothetical protein